MFKLFQPKTPFTLPQETDEQIKARAAKVRERMGDKLCTARNSTFKYKSGKSDALIHQPPASFKNAKPLI